MLGFNYFFKFNDSVYRYSDTIILLSKVTATRLGDRSALSCSYTGRAVLLDYMSKSSALGSLTLRRGSTQAKEGLLSLETDLVLLVSSPER